MLSLKAAIVVTALACPNPKLVNKSNEPWTNKDAKQMKISKVRCAAIYPLSPCLVKFEKTQRKTYWVICGKPVDESNR